MKRFDKRIFLTMFVCLSALFMATTSCSKDDDEDGDGGGGGAFAGTWSGTFTGDDSGTFEITINSSGKISGSATSTMTGEKLSLSGSVNDAGKFSASIAKSDASFTGTISGNSMSGTWQSPETGDSGTFTGSKDGGTTGGDSPFQGTWSGTFSGDDSGIFEITINSSGKISGSATSSMTGETFALSGSVNDEGDFFADITGTQASFTGAISGNSMSGSWFNPDTGDSGTFTGSKN